MEKEGVREEEEKKTTTRVGSLGWLAESGVMPKRQKAIEGVGVSSILELKAQLYRSQQESKRFSHDDDAQYHRAASRKPSKTDVFSHQNSGVADRDHGDKLELKAVNDGTKSYEALEKKAELYEKLVRGELSDEEENEKYCVDFVRKGVSNNNPEAYEDDNKVGDSSQCSGLSTASPSDVDSKRRGLGFTGFTGVGNEHKRLVKEVNQETVEAREKVSDLKQRRQLQAEKNREKLRQAFLRKQIEKLKAQKSKELVDQTVSPGSHTDLLDSNQNSNEADCSS